MHQIDCDGKITDLVQDMQALYAFLKETDPSKYDGPQRKVVTSLAQQTIECAYFIRQYASDPNFCKSYFIQGVDSYPFVFSKGRELERI